MYMGEKIPRGDMVEGWTPTPADKPKKETEPSSRVAGAPATEFEHVIEEALGKSEERLKEEMLEDSEPERMQPV